MQYRKTLGQRFAGVFVRIVLISFCVPLTLVASAKMSQEQMPKTAEWLGGKLDFAYAPMKPGNLVDYKGEIHVHSPLSRDARVTWDEIFTAAKQNKINWLIFTDHISDLPPGDFPASRDGVVLIYGNERNWNGKGSHFRIPVHGETKIHAYGHMEELKDWDSERWDAIELVNLHANSFNAHAPIGHIFSRLGSLLGKALFRPGHLYEPLAQVLPENLERWQELAERGQRPIPIFAAPDAHQNVRLLGQQLDPYGFMLGLVSTHIWLEADKPLNEENVLSAIRSGRTYICFDYLGDPTGFQFYARHEGQRFYTGETITRPARLWVSHTSAKNSEVRLFRDNTLVMDNAIDTKVFALDAPAAEPGFWRVEIWRDGKPWIISGQILVK